MKSGQRKFLLASLVVAFALAVSPAIAETVLWYHFNDGNVGESANYFTGSVIKNAVEIESSDSLNSLNGQPGGLTTGSPPSFISDLTPIYTNDFPSCVTWYDPATGEYGEDRHCLWMKSQYGDGSGESSVILTDDNEKLHCEKITVDSLCFLFNTNKKESLS